jgi:hypothetical protein
MFLRPIGSDVVDRTAAYAASVLSRAASVLGK